jgi:4-amino-4-deoxy-L-arabinose transferase-like glycosyltransferase
MAVPFTASRPAPAASRLRQWSSRSENQLLVLLAVLAFFPLLFELGRNPVQLWDESRLAVNAAQMVIQDHWLVPFYGSEPDHWNTKPPLLIWLQALSFKAFGFSTWALRLPTALASVTTVVAVYQFGARVLHRPLAGFFGALILVTSVGYVKLHVARTADYDAFLTMWVTIGWVCFFQYLENGRARYLYWVAVALTAAVLTKSVAGLLGVPGLLLYALLQRKLGWLLRQPRLYVAAALGAAIIIGYFVGREALDPGYWQAVKYNDLGGRFLENQGDGDKWYYYLRNMQKYTFTPWIWAIAPTVLLSLTRTAGVVRRGAVLLLLFAGGWLAVVSASASRHDWYDAPMYPALALLMGLGLAIFYQDVMQLYLPRLSRWQGLALQLAVVVGVFYAPYSAIIDQLIAERHSNFNIGSDGYLGRYLPKVLQDQPQLTDLTVVGEDHYNAALFYYQLVFATQGVKTVNTTGNRAGSLPTGTIAVVCDPVFRARLDSAFHTVQLHEEEPCQTLLLLPRTK